MNCSLCGYLMWDSMCPRCDFAPLEPESQRRSPYCSLCGALMDGAGEFLFCPNCDPEYVKGGDS